MWLTIVNDTILHAIPEMIDTKLILIEGQPGSGKSTTAQYIAKQCEKNNIPARWYHEQDNDALEIIDAQSNISEIRIAHWKAFVSKAKESETVNVLDSRYLMNSVGFFFAMDEMAQLAEFKSLWEDIVKPLNPVFIYFYQSDVEKSLRKTFDIRREDWEEWAFKKINEGTAFGKRNKLKGLDGFVTFFKEFRKVTDKVFDNFSGRKLAIENSEGEWEKYYEEISQLLALPLIDEEILPEVDLEIYVGRYRKVNGDLEYKIALDEENLYIYKSETHRLIAKKENILTYLGDHRFYIRERPDDIGFLLNNDGVVDKMTRKGAWYEIEQLGLPISVWDRDAKDTIFIRTSD